MPNVEVSILLPYFLRLAAGGYDSAGQGSVVLFREVLENLAARETKGDILVLPKK